MEPSQEPLTQAPPQTTLDTQSTLPSSSQPAPQTLNSTISHSPSRTISNTDPLSLPVQSHLGPTLPTPSAASLTTAALPDSSAPSLTTASSEPILPAQLAGRPEPTTAFARAEWNAVVSSGGRFARTEPDLYVDPPPTSGVPQATGIPAVTGPTRIVTAGEREQMKAEDRARIEKQQQEQNVMDDDAAKALTVEELRQMGFGRTKTGFCYSARMTLHHPLPGLEEHPEKPARIIGVFNKLQEEGLVARMQRVALRQVTRDEVLMVHSEAHWQQVYATGFQSEEYLMTCAEYFERLSLYINPHSAFAARLSCGGVIEMARAVAEGQVRNGFAIVRPPGHHAEPQEAMGFCLFNNVAVAAKWLLNVYGKNETKSPTGEVVKMKKILIIDWDIHHGNGTQAAFYDDPNVLYLSLHKHGEGFYPGGDYGGADKVGDGAGAGYSVNIPFMWDGSSSTSGKTSMGDADYLYAFQQIVMPIAYEFAPDMVIVSAGYDAAAGDPLGLYNVSPAGYAHMTHMLSVLANGKLLLALEGGYQVDSVVKSAHACVEVLVGDEPRPLRIENASPTAIHAVNEVKHIQAKYWKSMGESLETLDELRMAGQVVPLVEILKAHRTYELYNDWSLYNIEFPQQQSDLEAAFKDQLLVSKDIYESGTLVVFLHDLGSLKANVDAATLDLNIEKTHLVDTSHQLLYWAINELRAGVIDMNFLAHQRQPREKDLSTDPLDANRKLRKKLALHIWDNIVGIATATNIILVGLGSGAQAIIDIVAERPSVSGKVKACVSVHGLEKIPELPASSGMRAWFRQHSLVLAPSHHPIHEEVKRAGLKSKKYGKVDKPDGLDEVRPLHMVKASLNQVRAFVNAVLPTEEYIPSAQEEVEDAKKAEADAQQQQQQEDVQMAEAE